MVKYVSEQEKYICSILNKEGDKAVRIDELIKEMDREIKQEEQILRYMQKRLTTMPPGALGVSNINGEKYYYHKICQEGKKNTFYLDPDVELQRNAIIDLMEKKVITHGFPVLRDNIKLLKKCKDGLKPYHPSNYKYGDILGDVYYLEDDVCIRDWRKKPDGQNDYFRETLIHKTKSGKKVRSKSEVFIADSLYDLGLEFKCEAELRLAKRVVYPDFEILHPKTHKLIWWEHLGMLDDPRYVVDNLGKIIDYCSAGIVPGKNLIITYETKEQPLTHEMINQRLVEFGLV